MDYNNAYRQDWQPPNPSFEPHDTISRQGYPQMHSNQASRIATTEKSLSTAATMEALGIRIRPPGLHPPVPYYRPPRVLPGPIFSSDLANHPQASSWAGYGPDTVQQYSYPILQGGNELPFCPPVDRAENHLKTVDTIDFANSERIFQADLPQEGQGHQTIPRSQKYQQSDSDLLSIDFSHLYEFSTETNLSGYTDRPSRPSSEYTSEYTEYTPRSSLTLSSTALSPVPSPRCPPTDPLSKHRHKASPSPRISKRAAPYTLSDGARKRWSTGSYASSPSSRRTSPLMHASANPDNFQQHQKTFRFSAPVVPSSHLLPSHFANTPVLGSSPGQLYPQSFLLPSNVESGAINPNHFPPGTFRTLHSNVDAGGRCFNPYANLSEPPDLLGPLREEPIAPPAKDLNPDDTDLIPHEQELRFESDLYTPKWVRGHGNKREGWCGICKPGRWLVLKNSAFWYDKSFTHGVSAATGRAFEPPKETRRMEGNADIWEGLCGSCGEWIPLVSSKKKGTTWFRHAYKCQSQSKSKDAKRRREVPTVRPTTHWCPKSAETGLTTSDTLSLLDDRHAGQTGPNPTISSMI